MNRNSKENSPKREQMKKKYRGSIKSKVRSDAGCAEYKRRAKENLHTRLLCTPRTHLHTYTLDAGSNGKGMVSARKQTSSQTLYNVCRRGKTAPITMYCYYNMAMSRCMRVRMVHVLHCVYAV